MLGKESVVASAPAEDSGRRGYEPRSLQLVPGLVGLAWLPLTGWRGKKKTVEWKTLRDPGCQDRDGVASLSASEVSACSTPGSCLSRIESWRAS